MRPHSGAAAKWNLPVGRTAAAEKWNLPVGRTVAAVEGNCRIAGMWSPPVGRTAVAGAEQNGGKAERQNPLIGAAGTAAAAVVVGHNSVTAAAVDTAQDRHGDGPAEPGPAASVVAAVDAAVQEHTAVALGWAAAEARRVGGRRSRAAAAPVPASVLQADQGRERGPCSLDRPESFGDDSSEPPGAGAGGKRT